MASVKPVNDQSGVAERSQVMLVITLGVCVQLLLCVFVCVLVCVSVFSYLFSVFS